MSIEYRFILNYIFDSYTNAFEGKNILPTFRSLLVVENGIYSPVFILFD